MYICIHVYMCMCPHIQMRGSFKNVLFMCYIGYVLAYMPLFYSVLSLATSKKMSIYCLPVLRVENLGMI